MRCKDTVSEYLDKAHVDHIMLSKDLIYTEGSYKIWNPLDLDEAKPIKTELKNANAHFLITIENDG